MERHLRRRKFVDPETQAVWLRDELKRNGKSVCEVSFLILPTYIIIIKLLIYTYLPIKVYYKY